MPSSTTVTRRSLAAGRANRRALRILPILAVLGALLLPLGTAAAASVTIEARALVGGRYESGGWLALSISLGNDGAPVNGAVVADGADGSVRRPVDRPAGARNQGELYVRPAGGARGV